MTLATILYSATVLLAITAVGGLVMAMVSFKGTREPPTWLAMLHGFLAAAALTLLVYAAATIGLPQNALVALVLLLIAAVGGVILNLNYHWKRLPLPRWLIVTHAIAAVAGFVLLLIATVTA
jgi:hypothetical protein